MLRSHPNVRKAGKLEWFITKNNFDLNEWTVKLESQLLMQKIKMPFLPKTNQVLKLYLINLFLSN